MQFVSRRLELTFFLLFAGSLYLMVAAEYKKCYNSSTKMHCFIAPFERTIFDSARDFCNRFNSPLLIIEDEETNQLTTEFLKDLGDPDAPPFVWLDAYRVNDYDITYTWHWVDPSLPNVPGYDITFKPNNSNWYVAAVAFRSNAFSLAALQPFVRNSYICEYEVSSCSPTSFNYVRQFDGRCYAAVIDSVSWYEARNRCLKEGGDLASFVDVKSINFASWLRSDSNVSFWIGLRFSWYKWIDTGAEVRYANWVLSQSDVNSPCGVVFYRDYVPSWKPFDCTDYSVVICHTATSIATTVATRKTTIEVAMQSVMKSTISAGDVTSTAIFRIADGGSSRDYMSLGIGLGLGLGIPLAIVTILILVLLVKYKRLATQLKTKPSNESNELARVQDPKVEQTNPSIDGNNYQHIINRSTTGTLYDELNEVAPDDGYLEISST